MNYHFRVVSDESDDFVFEILIDDEASFFDLHLFIQNELKLDPSQITSFFLTDDEWNKETEITLLDMGDDENATQFVMERVKLKELVTQKRQRLLYVFDLFSERILFLEVIDVNSKKIRALPVCLRLEGKLSASVDHGFDLPIEDDGDFDGDSENFDGDTLYPNENFDEDTNYLSDFTGSDDDYY